MTADGSAGNWLRDFGMYLYSNIIDIERGRWLMYLNGLGLTLAISFFAILLGIVLGFLLALARISKNKILYGVSSAYISVIRGTPVIVQLMIIYYIILAPFSDIGLVVGTVAFGLNSAAYVAEIFRAGIMSIDKGQTEAGRSLGLTVGQTMRYIILPQAVKNVIPALSNEFIVLVKETAAIGYLGIMDLTYTAKAIGSRTYDYKIAFLFIGILYYLVVLVLQKLFTMVENRLRKSDM